MYFFNLRHFKGIDYVNFIVMFEQIGPNAMSIPDDKEWIVYSDPEETWNTALFSFPSNYEGKRARTNIRTATGHFRQGSNLEFEQKDYYYYYSIVLQTTSF